MKLYDELKWRGLIKDVAGEDIEKKLNEEKITFYWGTDPTADSLHIGHYSSLITAKRLANAGHHPILLVGGATGLIGDPRPTAEREVISVEAVQKNLEGIRAQIDRIFEGRAEVVNNYDWIKKFDFITFLRDVGKYINVNYMLSKDIISRRLETGITFAEFSYTLIQGYDFLHLFETKNCIMQAEGSDQWGNITTGLDLIKKKTGKDAYAFTMPLVLDANGNKFGKSEGNALWLDIHKTSGYELYQYLINSDDKMVESYLKIFTFLTPEEIMDVMKQHEEAPEKRIAQKTLAYEFIKDLHGKEEADKAVRISEALFSGNVGALSGGEIEDGFKSVPNFTIEEKEENIVDFLVHYGIASSKREAREFVTNRSISINGEKIDDLNFTITEKHAIDGKFIIVRRGKKKYHLGRF
ncbi:MAG TPA: tyrosine--tRNA ligase [Candidatus Fimihabitans intestinipullorum]|uniref:Tyrosine--tRNA ligase n=1 Tax=Candidatus Fimihabitans intestinipullorum TaxID=2840820 RepID=A0A9D1HW74_9BACT|nr:tyrosine--tRNA ligase [Candidatus Fimihabitans intestinipullorum]